MNRIPDPATPIANAEEGPCDAHPTTRSTAPGLRPGAGPRWCGAPPPGSGGEGSIAGSWGSREVTFAGEPLAPARSLAVRNHSPDGFSWGYAGSGPAQLALAILLRATDDQATAERLY